MMFVAAMANEEHWVSNIDQVCRGLTSDFFFRILTCARLSIPIDKAMSADGIMIYLQEVFDFNVRRMKMTAPCALCEVCNISLIVH